MGATSWQEGRASRTSLPGAHQLALDAVLASDQLQAANLGISYP
jgi:hypothetical protein